ncbi:hypothetical protein [Azospirillum argentinense]
MTARPRRTNLVRQNRRCGIMRPRSGPLDCGRTGMGTPANRKKHDLPRRRPA